MGELCPARVTMTPLDNSSFSETKNIQELPLCVKGEVSTRYVVYWIQPLQEVLTEEQSNSVFSKRQICKELIQSV